MGFPSNPFNPSKPIPSIFPKVQVSKPSIPKPLFNPFQERVYKVTKLAQRPITTRQVAKYSGISYNSAKNNLGILESKKLIKKRALGNRTYWWE